MIIRSLKQISLYKQLFQQFNSFKNSYFSLQELIKFRQNMHMNAEIGFQEFKTQQTIIDFLKSKDIQEQDINKCAKTGLLVNIRGKAEPEGEDQVVVFRADIDALEMKENNPHLPYQSQTKAAHMCGHDGHTTCLLGFTCKYLDLLDKVPSNKLLKLLFQPSEEGPEHGAKIVISEGWLDQVQEIYGMHNWPSHKCPYLMCIPGPVMSEIAFISIELMGRSGHSSEPHKCIDPIQAQVEFFYRFNKIKEKYNRKKFISVLTMIKAGTAFNVIPQVCQIAGSMRSLEEGLTDKFSSQIEEILRELKLEKKVVDYKLQVKKLARIVKNWKKQAEIVANIGKKVFKERVGPGVQPVMASEDFAYYLDKIPGALFFIGSGKQDNDIMLHSNNFNFNDDVIEYASDFWLQLAINRFGLESKINLQQ